jgi:hypothetical protein
MQLTMYLPRQAAPDDKAANRGMRMTHWIGAIILLAASAFVIFAFRQGEKIKPDKDKKLWWDDGGQYK